MTSFHTASAYLTQLEQSDGVLTMTPLPPFRLQSAAEAALAGMMEAPDCCILATPLASVIVGVVTLCEELGAAPALDEGTYSYAHLLHQVEEVLGVIAHESSVQPRKVFVAEAMTNDAALRVLRVAALAEAGGVLVDNTLFALSVAWPEWSRIAQPLLVAERFRYAIRGGREYGLLFGDSDLVASARRTSTRLGFTLDAGLEEQLRAEVRDVPGAVREAAEEADRLATTLRDTRPDLAVRLAHDVMRGAGWRSAASPLVFALYPDDAPFDDELALWQRAVDAARQQQEAGAVGAATRVAGFQRNPEAGLSTSYVRVEIGADAPDLRQELHRVATEAR